jgi:hypothetical protein
VEVGELGAGRDGLLQFGGIRRTFAGRAEVDDPRGLHFTKVAHKARGDRPMLY